MQGDLVAQQAERFLPGFGFYAPSGPLRLRVPVGQKLRRVSLIFEGPQEHKFPIPLIEFVGGEGVRLDKSELIERVRLLEENEEAMSEDELRARMISGRVFHTAKRKRARLNIVFKEPTQIKRLMLGSRMGDVKLWGRHFRIESNVQGRCVFEYDNLDEARRKGAFERYLTRLNLPETCDDPAVFQAALLRFVQENEKGFAPRELVQTLPIYDQNQDLTEFAKEIIAQALARLLAPQEIVSTATLVPLRHVLNEAGKIDAVLARCNEILSQRLGRDVRMMAGKHAIQESRLVRRKESYLNALDQIFPALRACGVVPMLAYGSLLGAVREEGFLAHDDDVDLLYHDGSRSREEALARRDELVKAMENHDFTVSKPARHENIHLSNGEVNLDLFPCWEEAGALRVMQRYPSYERLEKEVLLPLSEARLYERSYPAPGQAERFLEWRYGPGWSTPDPYHEWPWKLKG